MINTQLHAELIETWSGQKLEVTLDGVPLFSFHPLSERPVQIIVWPDKAIYITMPDKGDLPIKKPSHGDYVLLPREEPRP